MKECCIHYDFVLFENTYDYYFHYEDLDILARLLKNAGYSVAYADVFKERELCRTEGVPHITFKKLAPRHFVEIDWSHPPPKKYGVMKKIYFRLRQSLYLRYVIRQITPICDNVYLGTLAYYTPFGLWLSFRSNKFYYFWGLRSYMVSQWKKTGLKDIPGIISYFFYYQLHKRNNVKLFCSNDALKDDFIKDVDIEPERLIVRPERVITSVTQPLVRNDGKLRILSIGTTRKSKNIPMILDALKLVDNPNVIYTIAGYNRLDENSEEEIRKHMANMDNVIRINHVLTEQEYEEYLNNCDFMITCEGKQETSISSGTLVEALLHGKPVIGPNHNTYYDEIHGNGVGILFDIDNLQSLADAIRKAYDYGTAPYVDNLVAYQEKFLEEKVVQNLKFQIERN